MLPNRLGILLGLLLWGASCFPKTVLADDRLPNLKDPVYWSQLCTLLTDKPSDALPACERAIELRPRDAKLWAQYGSLLLVLHQYPEATAALEQSLARQPKNSQAWIDLCRSWQELGNSKNALVACDRALKVNANWGTGSPLEAHHLLSLIQNQEAGYQAALTFYDQVLAKQSTYSLALFYRGEALEKLGQSQAAIAAYRLAVQGDGNWGASNPALAWYVRGLADRSAGKAEAAIQDFDRALALEPNNGITWWQLGDTLRQVNRWQESLTAYNRAVELRPNASRLLLAQCMVLNQLQQAAPALATCKKAVQGDADWRDGDVALVWNQQSRALTSLNQLEDALAAANRAVGMRPDWAEGWNDRAVVLWYLTRYDEALASVAKALALNPNDAQIWANQGRILRSLNKPEQALNAYQDALKRAPQNAAIWANLSVVQWSLGDHRAALESANRAVTVNPQLVQGWQNRAVALVALQHYADAQESYKRAIQLDKTNAESWTGLGLVLAKLQQYSQAITALQTALSLNPKQAIAQQALKALTETQPTPTPEPSEVPTPEPSE